MKWYSKALLWGFLFGTIGLYILAAFSLVSPVVESSTGFLFAPGRFAAEQYAGSEGSNLEVAVLTLTNGLFFALIFFVIAYLVKVIRRPKSSQLT